MTEENPVTNPPEVVEEITDPVSQPNALPEKPVEHEPPPWAEKLIDAIESLPDMIAEKLPNPVAPEEIPLIDDETPVSKPWTHKGM